MKLNGLKDRREFLVMQDKIIKERLEKYIKHNTLAIKSALVAYNRLNEVKSALLDNNSLFEDYFVYRCEFFQENCTNLIECLSKNLFLSETKINYLYFTNLFRVKYVFHVLEHRIQPKGFKVDIGVDINAGNVFFIEDSTNIPLVNQGISSPNLRAFLNESDHSHNGQIHPVSKKSQGHTISPKMDKKDKKTNNYKILKKHNELLLNPPMNQLAKVDSEEKTQETDFNISGSYRFATINSPYLNNENLPDRSAQNTASIAFPVMNFPKLNFPNIEKFFTRPFKIDICINELNEYVAFQKVKIILEKISTITDMPLNDILYFSSYEYNQKYPFNELLPLIELNHFSQDIADEIEAFLHAFPLEKKMPILNIALNIAPGILHSIQFPAFQTLPGFYLIKWAERKASAQTCLV